MTRRFARKAREGDHLIDRDYRIVEAVFAARYMTLRQINDLLFLPTTFSYCKQRCRVLYDLGYLRKRVVHQNEPDIYYLGLKGKRHIASQGAWSREQVNLITGTSGGVARTPMLMMEHELTLARLYVNARLECAGYGWELTWKNARMLELEQLGMQPDAWLAVSSGDKGRQAFLEFTAAMPSASELSGKLERYQAYWERTQDPTAVLWLTTSKRKAQRLLEGIRGCPYRDYFLVGLIEDAGTFLTRRMWHWGDAPRSGEAPGSDEEGALNEVVQWLQAPESA
jgi:hypothetical protein